MYNSQEVANVIKALAKERNISIGKMLAELGLSINTMSPAPIGLYYKMLWYSSIFMPYIVLCHYLSFSTKFHYELL